MAVARTLDQHRQEDEAAEVADVAEEAADKETEEPEAAPLPGAPAQLLRGTLTA